MSPEDCDVLLSIAERQHQRGELGLGCMPEDKGLEEHERAVIARFEERVSRVTGCESHMSAGPAVFKLTSCEKEDA